MSEIMSETATEEKTEDKAEDQPLPKRIQEVVIVPCEGLEDEEVMRKIDSLGEEEQNEGIIYLLLTFPGKATLEDLPEQEGRQLLRLEIAGATDEETEHLIESLNLLCEQYPDLSVELSRMADMTVPLTPEQALNLKNALKKLELSQEDEANQEE